jgi:membrane-associated phospholipid phosphatase
VTGRARRAALPALTARESAVLGTVSVATLAVFMGLAAIARFLPLGDWETSLVVSLALGHDPVGEAVRVLNRAGNLDAWTVLTLVATAAVGLLRGARAALLVALSGIVDALNFLFKFLVERARPELALTHGLVGLDGHGFPSGHTARAAALAGALVFVLLPARWRLPAALAAAALSGLVMGYARIASGAHFPLDTLGGLALGLAWMGLTTLLVLRRA